MTTIIHGRDVNKDLGKKTCFIEIRIADDLKMNSIMSMNVPTSREYGRFTLMTSKYSSSSTVTSPRETNTCENQKRMMKKKKSKDFHLGSEEFLRRDFSPRSLTKISDYLNQEPTFSQSSNSLNPSRYSPCNSFILGPLYSPRKSPPSEQISARVIVRMII